MSEEETPPGKHTLAGDGEPSQPTTQARFRATMGVDEEGQPMLLIETEPMTFVIRGENLFNFYAMLKRGMEGNQKRAAYLG